MKKQLQKEINRCKELLTMYEEIPTGFFGATIIRQSISKAEKATTDEEIKLAINDLEEITG